MLDVVNGENAVALPVKPAPTGEVGLIPKLVEILLGLAADDEGVMTFPLL
jgi:hypothetical protein